MKEPDHSGPVRCAKTLAFYEMFTLPSVPKCCSPSPHLLHPFLHWKKSQQPWEFSKCMKSTKSPLPLFPLSFLLFTDSTKPNHSQVEYEIKTYSCQNFASHSTWGIWMGGCKTDRLLKFLYCWRSRWLITLSAPQLQVRTKSPGARAAGASQGTHVPSHEHRRRLGSSGYRLTDSSSLKQGLPSQERYVFLGS